MTLRGHHTVIVIWWAFGVLVSILMNIEAARLVSLPPPDPCARVHALRAQLRAQQIQVRAQQAQIDRLEQRTAALVQCWAPLEAYLRVVEEEEASAP